MVKSLVSKVARRLSFWTLSCRVLAGGSKLPDNQTIRNLHIERPRNHLESWTSLDLPQPQSRNIHESTRLYVACHWGAFGSGVVE